MGPNSGAACSLQLAHVSRLVPPECLLPVDLEHFPHQAGAPLGTLSGAEWVPSVSLTGFETAPDRQGPAGQCVTPVGREAAGVRGSCLGHSGATVLGYGTLFYQKSS